MRSILSLMILALAATPVRGQLVISGNENKIDLSSGAQSVVSGAEPDSLTILDFSTFPPKVKHLPGIRNTVIGPPSNIAITPNGGLALIADSLMVDPQDPQKTIPATRIHLLDLEADPPRVIGEVTAGKQPSGMSIAPNGKLALVANRAGGTVSVLSIDGKQVKVTQTVEVCEPNQQASDVAISPDGTTALVSINKGGVLRVLKIDGTSVTATERRFSTYGTPYRCVITPDGLLGLTAGGGLGGPRDMDALSIIDLQADSPRTIGYVEIGSGPESIEVSPDAKLVAAVLMNGSNLPADDPDRTENGRLVILSLNGKTLTKTQDMPIGRIPEGVAFTSDGRYLVVQCHPSRELWLFRIENGRVVDTGERISVPGFPSSLRAGG